jgi:hypothetical protein
MTPSPFDPQTEYEIQRSDSPIDVDGYKLGEPKRLVCEECGASEKLTEDPSAGVDDLSHAKGCSQRWAKSDWYREQLEAGE